MADIALHPLIVYGRTEYPDYHEILAHLFASAKVKPQIAEEHEGITSIIPALEAGTGVALLPPHEESRKEKSKPALNRNKGRKKRFRFIVSFVILAYDCKQSGMPGFASLFDLYQFAFKPLRG